MILRFVCLLFLSATALSAGPAPDLLNGNWLSEKYRSHVDSYDVAPDGTIAENWFDRYPVYIQLRFVRNHEHPDRGVTCFLRLSNNHDRNLHPYIAMNFHGAAHILADSFSMDLLRFPLGDFAPPRIEEYGGAGKLTNRQTEDGHGVIIRGHDFANGDSPREPLIRHFEMVVRPKKMRFELDVIGRWKGRLIYQKMHVEFEWVRRF